jgi:hypothetical protein
MSSKKSSFATVKGLSFHLHYVQTVVTRRVQSKFVLQFIKGNFKANYLRIHRVQPESYYARNIILSERFLS